MGRKGGQKDQKPWQTLGYTYLRPLSMERGTTNSNFRHLAVIRGKKEGWQETWLLSLEKQKLLLLVPSNPFARPTPLYLTLCHAACDTLAVCGSSGGTHRMFGVLRLHCCV